MASRKSSILKPLRAREPLQDLSQLIPNNDEEETTTTDTHKRRVSFACVNKIKEFEAGAECLTLLHTPAYDERFSISSDSYQSSLNENSRDKSMFNSNIELPKSPNISKHKVNDENVEVVEVDLFNVSRGAPSPGKMSAGDSSMDMTNMIAPHEITEYESEIENCYPLNLTKNVQLGSESQHFDEDILESSSMETTEALPCLITETMRTSQSEIFTQEAETSVEEETLYDCQEPTSPEQIIVRKSEIFLRDKPAVKRLSSEMIDPEEQDVVTVKRRSLTNDSCSDESNANIEQIVRNDRRKSVFPQSYVENQNIKSFLIREEKSTIINIDNAHHRAEVKEIKNVDVNIAYEKTCPKEIITGNQETLDIKNNENKSTSPQRNQGGELVHDVSLMTSQPEKHNTSDILASEPAVDGSNDTQPVKETRVPLSARKSSIPIAVCTKTAPVSRKSIIVANDDNKTAGNTSNISVNDTINVSKDMDITNAFHKTTHETFVKCLSQNTTNDAVKEMELTTALHKNTCLNKTDDSTKDMELSSALGENSQGIRVKGNSPEKPDDGAEMAELSREKPVEGIASNKTIMVAEDMELSNISPQNSQEALVKGISSNKTIDVTKEMDFTNLSSQNSQEIPLKSTSSNKTIDVTKEMELTAVSHQNHREITVKDIPSNKTIDGTREVELFVSFEENDREIANKVDEATKDAANIGIVGQKGESNEVKDVENKGAISTEKLPLNCTIENDNGSQDTTATPPTVQEISCQFVAANTNHNEIMAAVREEVEEIISLVCSENNSDGIRTNISSINDISKIIIDDDDNEKILETSRKCENTSSMIAECDASNLKAANITGDLTMCISQEENEVVTPAGNGSSLEIIKSSSPDIIQVVESSEDSVKSIASQEIQMNEIDPRFEEEKLKVLDNLKKLVKREIPHWSIKSIRSDEWIFDALWNRLQLKIIFGGRGNSCNAELHFIPKQPIIEDKELKKKAAQGDEVLKISVGPIIRKYKPKLDLFCSKVNDVVHLLHIISPDIIFAQQFAENFTNTILSYDIKLLKGMASFYVSSFKNQKMVKIEICLKMLERLSLSSMKVTQVIGNVDVNLIHDTFCEAGRDHDFFSLFVKKLWEKIEG